MDLVKFSVFCFFVCFSFYLLFVGLVHGRNQFDCMLYQYELVEKFVKIAWISKKTRMRFSFRLNYFLQSDKIKDVQEFKFVFSVFF